ncbi:hypothetical protein ACH5RR_005281 [Cinchona calisaya]|uniref:Uncharacterized protein n=1 Tax=Cinchona calisaya TaxID=153742 RepID=A0ABD3AKS1_9GENT
MEGRKKSDSSTFTDLFGSKDSSISSSSEIFGSIFAPPSKVLGRESQRPDVIEKKQGPSGQVWNTKAGPSESIPNKEMSSFYQEEKVQPCHLSSSIYYGGQDVYSQPQNTQASSYTTFTKDVGEDDSGFASRGNWWQGVLMLTVTIGLCTTRSSPPGNCEFIYIQPRMQEVITRVDAGSY